MNVAFDFMAVYYVADCAARVFNDHFPRPHGTLPPSARSHFRSASVETLRMLWRNGDSSERGTVAARVAIWRGFDKGRVQAIANRARNGGGK